MKAEELKIKFLKYWEVLPVEQQEILLNVAVEFKHVNALKAKEQNAVSEITDEKNTL